MINDYINKTGTTEDGDIEFTRYIKCEIDKALEGYTPGTPGVSGDYLPLSGGCF